MTPHLRKIPRIVIAAAHSGSGKTTLTCGILAALKRRGLSLTPFKIGPDYIDPGYLSRAAGRPAHNLDTWLTDEMTMKRIFAESAGSSRGAVIEGVMGLYDGGSRGVSSTAEISKLLRAPVVLVMNAQSMGESAAALALGFREYDREVDLRGVILNRLGSDSHRRIITEALSRLGIPVLGALARDDRLGISERHLGLLPADENKGENFEALVEQIDRSVDLEALMRIADSASDLDVPARDNPAEAKKAVIAVARDRAFSFYYPESLAELEHCGAQLIFFSPLTDRRLPECDGLVLGGGFPEMFAAALADNGEMKRSIAAAAASGLPIYAECGGYMYLTCSIADFNGAVFPMTGIVPARCKMNSRLQTVGYVEAQLLRNTVLGDAGMTVRGHEFHFSSSEAASDAPENSTAWRIVRKRTGETKNAGFAGDAIVASYLHLHFAGCPQAARNFVEACGRYALNRNDR
ncbi:MAG: cobyrinate a,c-diamide synthase [Pyramidobacter sp.]|jgi:cobyrinic acid a,c-diamide synthase